MTEEQCPAESVFYRALELEGEDRARYVRDACQDDLQLLAEVEQLLADYAPARNFLERPAAMIPTREPLCVAERGTQSVQVGFQRRALEPGSGGLAGVNGI